MRTVILHYHLFKNAGTSLDASLKEAFKKDEHWVTKEFPSKLEDNNKLVKEWILDNPKARVFSSHTAQLPPPDLEKDGVKILPLIFVRHPLDRIVSAYSFEKKQSSNTFGSVLARNTDLSGYINVRLSVKNDRQCRNFHTERLCKMFTVENDNEINKAKKALKALPFVGVVEEYSKSIHILNRWLQTEGFEDIELKVTRENISRKQAKTIDEKMIDLKNSMSIEDYDYLVSENSDDLILYQEALDKLMESPFL